MHLDSKRTCRTIALFIKPFAWWGSRHRRHSDLPNSLIIQTWRYLWRFSVALYKLCIIIIIIIIIIIVIIIMSFPGAEILL